MQLIHIYIFLIIVTFLLLFSRRTISIYFNGTTYIQATKPLNLTKPFSLSFRTCTGGQLLHQNGDNGLLFELVVHPGKVDNKTYKFTKSSLALSWQTIAGSRNLTVVNVGTQLDQNKPYDVVFTPKTAGQNANLTVRLGGVMYLVEVPDSFGSVEWKKLTLGQGFVGCVTFGNMFNLDKGNGTSEACPLDSMTTCSRKGM